MSDYPVPAAPMARRVAALLEAGMTRHAIAKRVGVDHRIINDLAAGKKYVAAVVRRMQGERVRVNRAEAAAVVARLRRHGLTDRQIYLLTRIKVDRYAPLQRDLQRQGVAA